MSDNRDPFSEVIGRALIDHTYRDLLMGGDRDDQVKAMMDAGLSEDEAHRVLPQLRTAVDSIRALYEHEVFGDTKIAAA